LGDCERLVPAEKLDKLRRRRHARGILRRHIGTAESLGEWAEGGPIGTRQCSQQAAGIVPVAPALVKAAEDEDDSQSGSVLASGRALSRIE
jgi:hypothetical protein